MFSYGKCHPFILFISVVVCCCVAPSGCMLPRSFAAAKSDLRSHFKGPSTYQYQIKYFTVPVDHFSFETNHTFQIRYLINSTFWKNPDGPIFFYTGNEGDIEAFAQNSGFMWDIAPKFGALLLFAEHRYYGKSLPYGNKSLTEPKYAGYLTSEQALADYSDFITSFKRNKSSEAPVVAFGGSYGGMLAAWFRMKYPYVVNGAIACSAPIWQFPGLIPCNAFGQIVTNDFKVTSKECAETIRRSWKSITNKTSTDAGKAWLKTNWKLCHDIKTTDDVATLKDWLSNVWTNLAMVNYPYAANFLEPLPAYPIKVVCSHMRNSSATEDDLLTSVFQGLNVYFNYTGQAKCLNMYEQSTSNVDDVGWSFQACSEMVMPMCFDGVKDFFEPSKWDFKAYSDECYKQWKIRPRESMAVTMYGGKNITAASNIVFSNGLLDPWSSGGVMKTLSDSLIAVIIPDGAHHLDLRGANKNDPSSVKKARSTEIQYIRKWLQ